jgi:hypothetical protein
MHLYDLSSAHPLRSHRLFHAAVSAPMMIPRVQTPAIPHDPPIPVRPEASN